MESTISYLLQCLAPWAIFSVMGVRIIWQFCREKMPRWLTEPLLVAALWGAAGAAVLSIVRHKIPGGLEIAVAIGAFIPIAAFIAARSATHPNPRTAFAGILLIVAAGYAMWVPYQTSYLNHYREDLDFVREASEVVPADSPVYLQFDWIAPLETFWMLYHSPRQPIMIRDPWQLAERSPGKDSAYILIRHYEAEKYAVVGDVTIMLESGYTRGEKDPSERRVLCRVTFHKTIPPAPEEYIRVVRRTLW